MAPPVVLIAPVKRRISVRDVTANGGLVRVLVARDLKVKYKQSVLGPIWLVFQPFALLVAFIVGFHNVAGVETEGVPYALFALTGLAVWGYFSSASAAGAISLIGNTNLVRYHVVSAAGAHGREPPRLVAGLHRAGVRRDRRRGGERVPSR